MFRWLGQTAKVFFLKRGLKLKGPEQFSYSSNTNYFYIYLTDMRTSQEILLIAIDGYSFEGMARGAEHYDIKVSFPLDELNFFSFEGIRFYGFNQLRYLSFGTFIRCELTLLPQRIYMKEWFTQKIYNYRTKFRQDRIEILRKIIESHFETAKSQNGLLFTSEARSVVQIFSEVYGQRIYSHPNYKEESARFRLILESLSETGELEKSDMHSFRLNATAVASISTFELEERRHRDSVRQNWLLFAVTVVMAGAAIVQAYDSFVSP